MEKNCNDIDNSRIYAAEYKEKDSSKLSRKKLKRKSKDDKDKEGITYKNGEEPKRQRYTGSKTTPTFNMFLCQSFFR